MKCLFVLALAVTACVALPDGAPEEACEDMIPAGHETDPTPGDDKYTLVAEANDDGSFTVTLSTTEGTPDFKGFFIQARSEATGTVPQGSWTVDGTIVKGRPCPADSGVDNGVTHVSATNENSSVQAVFNNVDAVDGLYFTATVVESFAVFSLEIRSDVVM